uniref:Uncharacterized protein n=1 Tax=Eptatretus burgeri TaxID=7764 RepID=A0A8C4QEW3_EPTBU
MQIDLPLFLFFPFQGVRSNGTKLLPYFDHKTPPHPLSSANSLHSPTTPPPLLICLLKQSSHLNHGLPNLSAVFAILSSPILNQWSAQLSQHFTNIPNKLICTPISPLSSSILLLLPILYTPAILLTQLSQACSLCCLSVPPFSEHKDLNPIEHFWDILEQRLGRFPPPTSKCELKDFLVEEWCLILPAEFQMLVDSTCHGPNMPCWMHMVAKCPIW